MSQYGMQMPGSHLQRGHSVNIYTGLLAAALVALLAATAVVFANASLIGAEGSAFGIHGYDEAKKTYDVSKLKD